MSRAPVFVEQQMLLANTRLERLMENDKKIAYGIIILGTLLSAAVALVPHYDSGYRLAFGVFLWNAVPYYAYLLLTGIASGRRLLLPGVLMIGIDVIAKGYQLFDRGSTLGDTIGLYTPLVLLIALAAGYVIGARQEEGKGEVGQ